MMGVSRRKPGRLRVIGWALGWGWLAGLAIPWAIAALLSDDISSREGWIVAGLALAAINAVILASAVVAVRAPSSRSPAPSSSDFDALVAACRNWHDRARMFSDREFERRKYAEKWFDVYRYELEFLLAERTEDRTLALREMVRDKQEWFRRKFFEYVETLKTKISRKGFLYTAILDDLQELRFELSSMAEIIERSGVDGYDAPSIRAAEIAVDRFVYRVANGVGVGELELRDLIDDVGELLKSQRKDWDELGFRQGNAPSDNPPVDPPPGPAEPTSVEPAGALGSNLNGFCDHPPA